jgi:hypothetical protein
MGNGVETVTQVPLLEERIASQRDAGPRANRSRALTFSLILQKDSESQAFDRRANKYGRMRAYSQRGLTLEPKRVR